MRGQVQISPVMLNGRKPCVSVVIPIYNVALHLEDCLASVLNQSGVELEVICIDDCSADRSAEIVDKIAQADPRVRVIRNSVNVGSAVSRNIGIAAARGDYIQFTDADDLLAAGALRILLDAAAAHGADVVRGALETLRNGANQAHPLTRTTRLRVGSLLTLPQVWVPWFHTCFLISRRLLLERDIVYPDLRRGADPVFLARVLISARKICILPSHSYTYRLHEHDAQPGAQTARHYLEHVEMIKELYRGELARCWDTYRAFIREDVAYLLARAALTPAELEELQNRLSRLCGHRSWQERIGSIWRRTASTRPWSLLWTRWKRPTPGRTRPSC
jgi:glycosyltransferase involved in cell wall biosynthesis